MRSTQPIDGAEGEMLSAHTLGSEGAMLSVHAIQPTSSSPQTPFVGRALPQPPGSPGIQPVSENHGMVPTYPATVPAPPPKEPDELLRSIVSSPGRDQPPVEQLSGAGPKVDLDLEVDTSLVTVAPPCSRPASGFRIFRF